MDDNTSKRDILAPGALMILIRVMAKTAANEHRLICVAEDGSSYGCDCGGFDGVICAHVDAVLVAQERAMVHPDDWELADRAVKIIEASISVSPDWRGAWRKNLRWRGLSSQGVARRVRTRDARKPLVCFTGNPGRPRAELKHEAEQAGWETIDSPSPFTDVLVAADPLGTSGKLKAARKNGTPIVSLEEWTVLMTDGVIPS